MHFNKVEIGHFRNLISTSLSPSPSLNVIAGSNGSGKSSLLEALYYLGTGTSFRTHRLSNIISHNKDCFTLFTALSTAMGSHRIGIQRCKSDNHQTRVDGRNINRRSDLVQIAPIQVLSPESIQLLIEGSQQRRNFVDWALFHVEHLFHHHLSHYMRALKQRNALLRSNAGPELALWDRQIIEHGLQINRLRFEYINQIKQPLSDLMQSLLPDIELSISYKQGWSRELSLKDALHHARVNDDRLKYTSVGPHRGDVLVRSSGSRATDTLSRGQLKLVVIALKLAQLALLSSSTNCINPIILIDDLAAELDIEHRAHLLETIRSFSSQLFITTPDLSLIDFNRWDERKVFHVEHGEVKEVV